MPPPWQISNAVVLHSAEDFPMFVNRLTTIMRQPSDLSCYDDNCKVGPNSGASKPILLRFSAAERIIAAMGICRHECH